MKRAVIVINHENIPPHVIALLEQQATLWVDVDTETNRNHVRKDRSDSEDVVVSTWGLVQRVANHANTT
jgi:hypothetical protein